MFTARIEPRLVEGPADHPVAHTVYDVNVYDGNGSGDEELMVFSNQGYENREFAIGIAMRLFATPDALAVYHGVTGGPFIPEPVTLEVCNADGTVFVTTAIRV